MVIYIRELDLSAIQSATQKGAAAPYIFKRGTTPQVGVCFVDESGNPFLYPAGTTVTLTCKAANPNNTVAPGAPAFDGTAVIAGAWAGGADDNGIYWIPMGFSNDTLNELLGFDPPDVNDDVVSVTLSGEVMTVTPALDVEKSQTFTVIIQHDLNSTGPDLTFTPPPSIAQTLAFGSQAIGAAVDFVAVNLAGFALPAAPALILAQVVKAGGGEGNIDCALRAGWTAAGFTVDLTGVTPDASYVLTFLLVPNVASIGSIDVPINVDTLAVPLALPGAPTLIVPVMVKAGAGEGNIRAFLRAGWTGAGFTVDFSGVTPDATYVLYYFILP